MGKVVHPVFDVNLVRSDPDELLRDGKGCFDWVALIGLPRHGGEPTVTWSEGVTLSEAICFVEWLLEDMRAEFRESFGEE